MILMLKSLCLKFVLNLIMKKLIFFIPIIIFAFLFLFTNTIYAQYGTYTCFGSGSTGGCRLGTSNCTNGGQIPNPSGCNGLQPAQCNSASFGCVSPSSCGTQGQTCVNAGNCCSGYQIMTASGDPRKLQAGKELLTAAVTGVVLLALTAFILRVIGVDILGIF